ncbi:MAG: hypothetical protein GEU28_06455 [Dehalococcoidia bacterium]|nr:hypothetical protein [Dehalococcoidia bacterium]
MMRLAGVLYRPIGLTVMIKARPEDVWAVVADLPSQPRWMTDALVVSVEAEGPYGVGTRARVPTRIAGITVNDVIEITHWDPPRLLGIRHSGLFSGQGSISIEPAGAGSRLELNEDLRPPLGVLGMAAFRIGRPLIRRQFAANLGRLKRLVEGA